MSEIFFIAHRGNKTLYPENTFAAFDEAIRNGCQAIETDIQLSKDGKAFIYHNFRLHKHGNAKRLASLDAQELSQIEVGNSEHPSKPPLLSELLRQYSEKIEWLLEIKWHKQNPENNKNNYVKTIVDVIRQNLSPKAKDFYILCFDPSVLDIVHQLEPTWKLVLNIEDKDVDYPKLDPKYFAISLDRPLINKKDISMIKDFGFKTAVFTANTKRAWQKMLDAGVDMIMTDCPHKVKNWQS